MGADGRDLWLSAGQIRLLVVEIPYLGARGGGVDSVVELGDKRCSPSDAGMSSFLPVSPRCRHAPLWAGTGNVRVALSVRRELVRSVS